MAEQHYMALYRKYRPRTFEDVRGRDVIVRTLKNQIISGRIAHSYLFCGTRGTGKTTIAKIFAKAVNCENPLDGSPCGECPSCRAIGRPIVVRTESMGAPWGEGRRGGGTVEASTDRTRNAKRVIHATSRLQAENGGTWHGL